MAEIGVIQRGTKGCQTWAAPPEARRGDGGIRASRAGENHFIVSHPVRGPLFQQPWETPPGFVPEALATRCLRIQPWRQAALGNSQPHHYQLHGRGKPFRPSWSPHFLICKLKVNMPSSKTDI